MALHKGQTGYILNYGMDFTGGTSTRKGIILTLTGLPWAVSSWEKRPMGRRAQLWWNACRRILW